MALVRKIPEGLQLAGLDHVPISEPISVARRMEDPSLGLNVLPMGKRALVSEEGNKRPGKTETTDILGLEDWEHVVTTDDQKEKLGGRIT